MDLLLKIKIHPVYYITILELIYKNHKLLIYCYGAEVVATEYIYLRSLQDIARSIVRVKGIRRVIYLRVADVNCTRGIYESTGLSYGGPCGGVP